MVVAVGIIIILVVGSTVLDYVRRQNIKGLTNEITRLKDYISNMRTAEVEIEKQISDLKKELNQTINDYKILISDVKKQTCELHDLKVRYLELLTHYNNICSIVKLPEDFKVKNSSNEMIEKAFAELKNDFLEKEVENVG
jgi:hypothetical protein